MKLTKKQSEKAAKCGYWPMYRYNPDLRKENLSPLMWDGAEIDTTFEQYLEEEIRYKTLSMTNPEESKRLFEKAQKDNEARFKDIKQLS
jgi:pyruvate-ferredoxin/flavodoxin oxidoreductase